MGEKIYWIIVAIAVILGLIMNQGYVQRKLYVTIMTVIHIFVCGFRYKYLVGDLIKYSNGYTYYAVTKLSWFDKTVWNDGRNAGFEWIKKFFAMITNGDYQLFLLTLAVITQVCVAIVIYKYSPKPWLSFVVWNCMGFFVTYDMCAIKQGLAMGMLMLAFVGIMEHKFFFFLLMTALAGFVHAPALCFLPAYWLANRKLDRITVSAYIIFTIVIFLFRNRIVEFVTEIYYAGNDEISFEMGTELIGGRFFMILLILIISYMIGFKEHKFSSVYNLIIVSAIFQMFSVYNNVFTRLADYYLQFLILLMPMMFYKPLERDSFLKEKPLFVFNERSLKVMVFFLTFVLIWWYKRSCLVDIQNPVDDYTNYRFMWEVNEEIEGTEITLSDVND